MVWIGCSGWSYSEWRGVFYPDGLSSKEWLSFYSGRFDTVELNNSFYRLPRAESFAGWRKGTGRNFLWAVKASRYITHIQRLKNTRESVKLFLERAGNLGGKLGPVLFQLPPGFKFDAQRLASFLSELPKKCRYVIEVRHPSWVCRECFDLLGEYNVAFCIADTAGKFPYAEEVTADFVYIRLHGHERLYESLYSAGDMGEWASKIRKWDKETFVYFDNTANGNAVKNALQLKNLFERKTAK